MVKTILNVEGMSCSHCENSIKNALKDLEKVTSVEVSLKDKQVIINHEDADLEKIKETIINQGYEV